MSEPFRIIVTGTREQRLEYRRRVGRVLDGFVDLWVPQFRQIIIVHGRCPYGGVDAYAEEWAHHRADAEDEPHPMDRRHGKMAGPIRNTAMVKAGADYCLGFPGPGSRGTWDCLRKAVDADIPTKVFVLGASVNAD